MSQSQRITIDNDPIEAIFALNMGDFLTEHLISQDLLKKIDTSVKGKIDRLKKQLSELISIYSLDNTLTLLGFNSEDECIVYNSIAKTMAQMLDVDSCRIYLTPDFIKTSKEKGLLVTMGASCIDDSTIGCFLSKENNPIIQSFLTCETIYIKNYKEDVSTLLAVPMANNWGNVGVVCVENKELKNISQEYINLLEITASLFVTSMRLQKLTEQTAAALKDEEASPVELRQLRTDLTASIGDLGDEQQQFVEALACAVDIKSQSHAHSKNVAELARDISEHINLNEKTLDLIYYAGLLHNIGQISLPEEIFSSTEKPSQETWEKLQNHPNIGVNVLMKINFLSEVIPYVHYHKERWDGKGTPEGLSGMSIPLGARIIAVADAYQAMNAQRSYRTPLSQKEILDILKKEAGIKWDPAIVNALYEIKNV
ncbi:MAG: HD domain-containing phosphohydrolase [bacterium]